MADQDKAGGPAFPRDVYTGKLVDMPYRRSVPNGEFCEACGTELVDRCMWCGAPVCCPKCCDEATTEAMLAEKARRESERGEADG